MDRSPAPPGGGPGAPTAPSARQTELLELVYRYALEHGLADLSLRPVASAVGSSPRVLLYLFGSKDGLVRAVLARAREDELALLGDMHSSDDQTSVGLDVLVERLWTWLVADEHRALLTLWVEGYARSLIESDGPWGGFARDTVDAWMNVFEAAQPVAERATQVGRARRTLALAVLRGSLMDLLATGDVERTTAAVRLQLDALLRRESGQP